MTRDDDFIGQLEGYLDEYQGVTPLPAAVRAAVRAQLPTTMQRGGLPNPMTFFTKNRPLQIALAAVAALAVGLAALSALNPRIGTEPTPTEQPAGDLGIFERVAGRIVYGDGNGIWGVDPTAPADPATTVQLTSEAGIPLGWSSDGTRLLIMRESRGEERLSILHADGSETQLTGRPATEAAAISPDGSRVVFAGSTREDSTGALYVVDVDGGPARMLREASVADLTFSPDGTQVAYVDWGSGDSDHSVWLMDADGSDAHQIVANEVTEGGGHVRGHGLAWSPTGDRIALALEGAIYTFAPDGSGFTRAIPDGQRPYWSPDGSQLASEFEGSPPAVGPGGVSVPKVYLQITDADGSNVRRFGFGASGPWHPAPGADHPTPSADLLTPIGVALRIVFVESTDQFHLLPVGSETQVTTDPMSLRGVAISPDRSRVVFAAGTGEFPKEPRSCCSRGFALYAVDADGGPADLLLQSQDSFVEVPTFAPDGSQIAYVVGAGDNGHSVWLMDADGSDAHQIVSNEWTTAAGHVSGLVWLTAGDRIRLTFEEGSTYSFASDGSDFRRE